MDVSPLSVVITLLDGEIVLTDPREEVTLSSGEIAETVPGKPTRKSAVLNAIAPIQWCLYYPSVLDPSEVRLSEAERQVYAASLDAYARGDVVKAAELLPDAPGPGTDAARVWVAAVRLAMGQAKEAEALLRNLGTGDPTAEALREVIATVQNRTWQGRTPPALATEWLAESYHSQSLSQLGRALEAARSAVARSPQFGFGWVRVAELEFSFGRTASALAALEQGKRLTPRNAQALALEGFALSARRQVKQARASFNRAIELDSALGNAWLGRGLCAMYEGDRRGGREDLQVAAALEPQRSLLRSYLGKAFHQTGDDRLAERELTLAQKLDPGDPTAWLYLGLIQQQANRINEAIDALEESQRLNGNRSLFRSGLLLDQDRAVRGANLAAGYRDAGMNELARRTAARAVDLDYANASAHRFLAETYDTLRDPSGYALRYDAAAASERVLANLLAPVGAGSLSQYLAQQDNAPMFEGRDSGFSSLTEYQSSGAWSETGSHYGRVGGMSYALDAEYRSYTLRRPNTDVETTYVSAKLKQQLTGEDSLYLDVAWEKQNNGDRAQYYNPTRGNPYARFAYLVEPDLTAGYHHEWGPGSHTLVLASRTSENAHYSGILTPAPFLIYSYGRPYPSSLKGRLWDYTNSIETTDYTLEWQQLYAVEKHTFIVGALVQTEGQDVVGWAHGNLGPASSWVSPIARRDHWNSEREGAYGYYQWAPFPALRIIAGVGYDRLKTPMATDALAMITDAVEKSRITPKAGVTWEVWQGARLRGAFEQMAGPVSTGDLTRMEPTELAGFNQAYRQLAPSAAGGYARAPDQQGGHLALDQRLGTRTYISLEAEALTERASHEFSGFSNPPGVLPFAEPSLPTQVREQMHYTENGLSLTVDQLVGHEWSFGGRYEIRESRIDGYVDHATWTRTFSLPLERNERSTLQQVTVYLIWNHPSGFFSQLSSRYDTQDNQGFTPAEPGASFWQHDVSVGYRFAGRKAVVRMGLMNLTGQNYQMEPLTYYPELPRARTLVASFKLNF